LSGCVSSANTPSPTSTAAAGARADAVTAAPPPPSHMQTNTPAPPDVHTAAGHDDVAGEEGGLFGAAAQNEAAAGDEQRPIGGSAADVGTAADGEAAAADVHVLIEEAAAECGAASDAPAGMLPGAVPAMHVHVQGLANAESTLLHSLAAREQSLDENEQELLRDDLTELIWADRCDLVQPFVG